MQQFDTMTLVFPPDAVGGMDSKSWISTVQVDGGTGQEIRMWQAKPEKLPVGVSRITYREGGDYLLTMSAKVLGQDYLDGITRENWYRGLEAVAPILAVDPGAVYETGLVSKCDTTNNIQLEAINATTREICQAILAGKRNQRFTGQHYNTKRKQGVVLAGTQEEKNRLIGYSKALDLQKPANKPFLRSINDPAGMIDKAWMQFRVEVNHTSHKSIRDRLGVVDVRLQNLLDSTKPVNRDFLNKILNPGKAPVIDLFVELDSYEREGGDRNNFVYDVGMQTIIEWSNYSEEALKALFQRIYPNENTFKYHWFKKHKSVKKILDSMKCRQFGLSVESVNVICNKLLDQLYLSVVAA